jgi:protein-disulfide isomerase
LNSTVEFTVFSDFECPACGVTEPMIRQLMNEYSGNVKFVFKQFPLTSIHPQAFKAAEASECADDQGKFWEYHDVLFKNQNALSVKDLKQYAADLGLDTERFNICLDSDAIASRVRKDVNEAKSLNLRGTPTFLVNGVFVDGNTLLSLRTAIEAALAD